MVATKLVNLPTEEELSVPEVNLSISSLRAGAFHLGSYCEHENNEFMLCKQELQDPRKCLNEGKNVTSCALSFFRNVKQSCHEEFKQYANCLNRSSSDMKFQPCRNTQGVFDKCMSDNFGMERPEYGYFCRIKVHHTNRPKPDVPLTIYSDTPDKLPEDVPKQSANFGTRNII